MSLAIVAQRLIDALATQTAAQLAAATLGPGTATRAKEWVAYAKFGAGTTAGVVTVEAASDPNDAGTWASIGTLSWSAASKTEKLNFTGIHSAIRARISTNVVGGTVTVDIAGRE